MDHHSRFDQLVAATEELIHENENLRNKFTAFEEALQEGAPRKPTSEVIHLTMRHLEDEAHRPSHIAAQVPVTPACRFVGFLLGSVVLAWAIRGGNIIAIPECGSVAHVKENAVALSLALACQELQRYSPSASPFNTCPMD
jgi:aryl-alcohol dehydrogenase-like predicted oxidoreductase